MADRPEVTEVAPSVWLVECGDVNWTVLGDGDRATLIDAGYPRDAAAVQWSLARCGYRLGDVAAVLVTHGHTDHIGAVPALLGARPDLPVLAAPAEVAHLHRDRLEQVTPRQVVANLARPGYLGWSLRVLRAGGLTKAAVTSAQPFTGDPAGGLDLPGRPRPVPVPGHTSGHCAFHLPEHGVVVAGDALVTAHPTARRSGPQLLDAIFHHDLAQARGSLQEPAGLEADVLLTGHGPVHRGPVAAAVARALDVPRRT